MRQLAYLAVFSLLLIGCRSRQESTDLKENEAKRRIQLNSKGDKENLGNIEFLRAVQKNELSGLAAANLFVLDGKILRDVDRLRDDFCKIYFQPSFVDQASNNDVVVAGDRDRIYKVDQILEKNPVGKENIGFQMWVWEHSAIMEVLCAVKGKIGPMTVEEVNNHFDGIAKFTLKKNQPSLINNPPEKK